MGNDERVGQTTGVSVPTRQGADFARWPARM